MQRSTHEQFRADGVVFLSAALDEMAMEAAETAWKWSIANPGPYGSRLLADASATAMSPDHARSLESTESGLIYQDISNPRARDAYESLVTSPAITGIVGDLFGADERPDLEAWFLSEQVFLKEPGSPRTGWHQDISDIAAEGFDMAVLWITFDPVPTDRSLELVKGSHLGPVHSSIYGKYKNLPIPAIDADRHEYEQNHEIVSYACKPGDVVAFHLGTLHGGAGTGRQHGRRTLALRFIGTDCRALARTESSRIRSGEPFRRKYFIQVR